MSYMTNAPDTQIIHSLSPLTLSDHHKPSATYAYSLSSSPQAPITDITRKARTPSIPQSITVDTDEDNSSDILCSSPFTHAQHTDIDIFPVSPMERASKHTQRHKQHPKPALIPPGHVPRTPNDTEDDDIFDRILFSFSRQESVSRDKRRSISYSGKYSRNYSKTRSRRSHQLPILGPNIDDILSFNATRPRRGTATLIVPSPSRSGSRFHLLGQNDTMSPKRWIDSPSLSATIHSTTTADFISQYELLEPPLNAYTEPIDNTMRNNIRHSVQQNVEATIRAMEQEDIADGRRTTIRPIGSHTPITRYYSAELDQVTDINTYIDSYIESDDDDDDDDDGFNDIIMSIDDDAKTVDPLIQSELVFESTTQSLMVSCGNSKMVFGILRGICVDLKKNASLPYIISFEDKILQYEHVEAFLKLLGFMKDITQKHYICDSHSRVETRLIDCAVLECQKCLLLIQRHGSVKDLIHNHRTSTSIKLNKHKHTFVVPTLATLTSQQSDSYTEIVHVSLQETDEKYDEDIPSTDSLQLYELIWSITHNKSEAHHARDVLLLCYPLVTTETHMMQCLELRLFNDDDECINASETLLESKSDDILSSFSVQAKVIGFIRRWMQRYWTKDWKDNIKLISLCQQFTQRIRNIYDKQCDEKGLRLVELLNKTMLNQKRRQEMDGNNSLLTLSAHIDNTGKNTKKKKHKKTRSIFRMSLGSDTYDKEGEIGDVIDVNHVLIAEQITLQQFGLFKSIHHRECLKQSWKDQEHKHILAPNIIKYIDAFNNLTKWIQSSILAVDNVRIRGKTIKKWVKVEEELYKLRNFQALCAVFSALASTAIYRLKSAWSCVAKKHMVQHDMIAVVMKSNANWKNLRRLELETHPPMIPYFGMFAQDLIVIEEITNNLSNDGSINWDALWRVNAVIDKYLIYQNTKYHHLSLDDTIQEWMNKEMNKSSELDDNWAYQMSQHVCKNDKEEMTGNRRKKSSQLLLFKSK